MNENNMLPPSGGSFLEKLIQDRAAIANQISPHAVRITREMVPPSAYIFHNAEWISTQRWAIRKRYIRRKPGFSILGQVTRFNSVPKVWSMEDSEFWPLISGEVQPLDISRATPTNWIFEGSITAGAPASRLYKDFLTRLIYFPNSAAIALQALRVLVLQTSEQDCFCIVANAQEVVGLMHGSYRRPSDGGLPPGVHPPIDLTQSE